VFRRTNDCTLTGLHVSGIHHHAAAVLLEDCTRINLTGSTILDSDGVGLKLINTTLTRVSGLVIRDDRTEVNSSPALAVVGGHSNTVVGNALDRRAEIAPESGRAHDNEVTPRVTGTSLPATR